ncbi:iron-sulfur cluster assembly accessory protein [Bacteriovoracales bacterium]|nr:iron-sulfur cluster assembly accessory protein [Bacteriovoracales bacterium]
MDEKENLLQVTDKALCHITEIFQQEGQSKDKGIRFGVIGGGCSGLSYKIEFCEEKENDNILFFGEVKVLIDPKSSIYLKGITIDFSDGLNGKGFVFKNPNATNTCGCGESFSIS